MSDDDVTLQENYLAVIDSIRSRLTIAMEALKAIRDHEHSRFPECDDSYEMTEMEQTGFGQYLSGCGHGHRCCAAIAREGLKRMEGVK